MERAAGAHEALAGHFGVDEAGAGGHPLDVAGPEDAVVAPGIAMLHLAAEQVGDGLEAAMGMGREAAGVTGGELGGAHLVEQQEGVDVG